MRKYTPNQWQLHNVEDLRGNHVSYRIVAANKRPLRFRVIATTPDGTTPENRANAQLIAAAPDLLEALERLATIAGNMQPATLAEELNTAVKHARQVIATATQ